jgi:hypothetical protein
VFTLRIKANVKVPIFMSPRYLYFSGNPERVQTRIVKISAGLDKDLTLTPTQFNLEGKLTYAVEEIEEGRQYQIRFENIPGSMNQYQGFLKLKTNYPERPEVTIRIRARFLARKKPGQTGPGPLKKVTPEDRPKTQGGSG